ncbi:MAG: OsmC family protein [Micromonosporaceae bacterium]
MGQIDRAGPAGNGRTDTRTPNGAPGAPAASRATAAAHPHPHDVMHTSCGRTVTLGRLKLSGPEHPLGRVSMNIGCEPHDHGQVWMSLTASECRRLAGILLAQAAAADRECAVGEDRGTGAAAQAAPAVRRVLPPGRIEVGFLAGEAYEVRVRGHHMLTDQPIKDGGRDVAATPTELLVTSLASCVAYYAGRYLSRHGLSRDGLHVSAEFDLAAHPARVGAIRMRIRVPSGFPPERASALLAVASHCTVHNTLEHPPTVEIALA